MSISYSLVIRETPALLAVDSEGYLVDDPNAQWLAGAKGFVPRTWWSLFEFAELRLAQRFVSGLDTIAYTVQRLSSLNDITRRIELQEEDLGKPDPIQIGVKVVA